MRLTIAMNELTSIGQKKSAIIIGRNRKALFGWKTLLEKNLEVLFFERNKESLRGGGRELVNMEQK